jgi:hypothetical protein
MFPNDYFPGSYYPPSYWPKTGGVSTGTGKGYGAGQKVRAMLSLEMERRYRPPTRPNKTKSRATILRAMMTKHETERRRKAVAATYSILLSEV